MNPLPGGPTPCRSIGPCSRDRPVIGRRAMPGGARTPTGTAAARTLLGAARLALALAAATWCLAEAGEPRAAGLDGVARHGRAGDAIGASERVLPALHVPVPVVDRERAPAVRHDEDAPPSAGPRASSTSPVLAAGGALLGLLVFAIVATLGATRSRAHARAGRTTAAPCRPDGTLESRGREQARSPHDGTRRLATVNDRLRALNAAFAAIGAPGPTDERLAKVAHALREVVPASIAVAAAYRSESGSGPTVGLDADAQVPAAERERWHRAALDSDRSGDGPEPGGALVHRLRVPLPDAHGRGRGFLGLGRDGSSGGFAPEDRAVLAQFALLAGSSLAVHEALERERAARAEAERADRAKEEVLAIVSHELRTPLNAIQGWLHVLRRRRAGDALALGRAIDVIQRNLDIQVQLVDDLLDTARIVGGTLPLSLQPLDLVPLLQAAVDTVRPLAERKRIALSVTVADGGFATVGDAARLEQAVWHLLTNAVKFTAPGGHVAVRLERLGWLAQLEVEDDGQGIDPAFLPQVFDRFRQADSSSTRAAGGLGLGLALVRHIVKAHGGRVMVRSEGVGRGSCFTVSLPLGMGVAADAAGGHGGEALAETGWSEAEPPAADETAAPLAGLRVLVVEDHDDSREVLAECLAAQGATVYAAADGREAMAAVRDLPTDGPPPVLLCDIALPGENGYAVLERIRRHERQAGVRPASRIVAFALSAFTRAEDRERSLQAGFREHLGKPLSQAELVGRLARLRDEADDGRPPSGR